MAVVPLRPAAASRVVGYVATPRAISFGAETLMLDFLSVGNRQLRRALVELVLVAHAAVTGSQLGANGWPRNYLVCLEKWLHCKFKTITRYAPSKSTIAKKRMTFCQICQNRNMIDHGFPSRLFNILT